MKTNKEIGDSYITNKERTKMTIKVIERKSLLINQRKNIIIKTNTTF